MVFASFLKHHTSGLSRHAVLAIRRNASWIDSSVIGAGQYINRLHYHVNYSGRCNEVEVEENAGQRSENGVQRASLAKGLACLPEESYTSGKNDIRRLRISSQENKKDVICDVNELRGTSVLYTTLRNHQDINLESEIVREVPSLAKSLACLPDESSISIKKRERTRMELKRAIETRIKKRVKEQHLNGKFHNLWEKVIANADTLQDSYDIVRLNSNVNLASAGDDICFVLIAEQLITGKFDIHANTLSFSAESIRNGCLILPNLKLRIIQEAVRVVLEVVYRPHFSRISHGCRSGRGHQSALRYIRQEVGKTDWWFTLRMKKKADKSIVYKIISTLEEKIEDAGLFSIIWKMFDAKVVNLKFGGFPKGQGLPQEGVLSPILMNIYLHNLDSEIFRIFMRHEGLGLGSNSVENGNHSQLRTWFRRQMKDNNAEQKKEESCLKLHACRYMDEIFVAVSGSKETADNLKNEIENYMKNSLSIQVDGRVNVMAAGNNSSRVQFLGVVVCAVTREYEAVRAVHKLKDKIQLFAAQKQEIWDTSMVRIGKKSLGHGLRRMKESEIKQLGLSCPVLDKISEFRKEGMKTEHWFATLLKIWLQDVNPKAEASERTVLSKYLAEPALPEDLKHSFFNFQKHVEEYVLSETASTLALSSDPSMSKDSSRPLVTKIEAPIHFIRKRLLCYGLVNTKGFPRHVSDLMLQDDIFIVHWFSGLVHRWLKWYSGCDNFKDVKLMMVEYVKMSCIRTLAAKHRMHENLIEKHFELELNTIPLTEDLEVDVAPTASNSSSEDDEALTYGISNSGLCMLSLAVVEVPSRPIKCFVVGCSVECRSMYTLHVKEQQKFPGWKTGFSTAIHQSLNGENVALCDQHVKDLYGGRISLQAIQFGALER